MTDRKRATTNPLTPEEIGETLFEIPAEEFIDQFDEIFSRENRPETLEQLITLDDYMEQELREMFQSIIAQYLQPIEFAVSRIREGDQSRRTVSEALDAVGPIINASATLEYDDITVLLREIETPLKELCDGAKRRLSKREVAAITNAWGELLSIVRPASAEAPETSQAGVSLGSLPKYVESVTAAEVRRLRAAGLTTLREIASAPVDEVAQVAGLDEATARAVHAFATGVHASSAARVAPARAKVDVPAGWMRVSVDSDVLRGRFMFEYGILARHIEPILARLAEADEGAARVGRSQARPRKRAAKKATKGE